MRCRAPCSEGVVCGDSCSSSAYRVVCNVLWGGCGYEASQGFMGLGVFSVLGMVFRKAL